MNATPATHACLAFFYFSFGGVVTSAVKIIITRLKCRRKSNTHFQVRRALGVWRTRLIRLRTMTSWQANSVSFVMMRPGLTPIGQHQSLLGGDVCLDTNVRAVCACLAPNTKSSS